MFSRIQCVTPEPTVYRKSLAVKYTMYTVFRNQGCHVSHAAYKLS